MKNNERQFKTGRGFFKQKFKLYRPYWNFPVYLFCLLPKNRTPTKAGIQPKSQNFSRTGILLPVFFILFLSSCQTLPPPWTAPSLTLKVKGALIPSKIRIPWTAYIYLKGENNLRLDVVTPLGGTVFRLFARGQIITLQSPLKKSYCLPPFNKYKLWVDGPSFSLTNVVHLLRNKTPVEWSCFPSNKSNECALPDGDFKVFLKTGKRKKTIELRKGTETKLSFTIIPLSGTPLEDKVFTFNTQGWTRLASCDKNLVSF